MSGWWGSSHLARDRSLAGLDGARDLVSIKYAPMEALVAEVLLASSTGLGNGGLAKVQKKWVWGREKGTSGLFIFGGQ